jgi:hypothetical protein
MAWSDEVAGARSLDVFDIHAYPDTPGATTLSGFTTAHAQNRRRPDRRARHHPEFVANAGPRFLRGHSCGRRHSFRDTNAGTLSSSIVTTDSSGLASVVLTLPAAAGAVRVTAEGPFGLGHPVARFTETSQ